MSDDFEMDDFSVDDVIDAGPDEMSPSDDEPTEADYLDMVRPSRAGLAEEDAYRAWETETPPARRWLREEARYCMPVMCFDEDSGIVTLRDHSGRWRMMRGMEAVYAHLLKSQLSQCRRPHPAVVQRTCRRRRASSHHRASTARAPDEGDGPADPPVEPLLDLGCPASLHTCTLPSAGDARPDSRDGRPYHEVIVFLPTGSDGFFSSLAGIAPGPGPSGFSRPTWAVIKIAR